MSHETRHDESSLGACLNFTTRRLLVRLTGNKRRYMVAKGNLVATRRLYRGIGKHLSIGNAKRELERVYLGVIDHAGLVNLSALVACKFHHCEKRRLYSIDTPELETVKVVPFSACKSRDSFPLPLLSIFEVPILAPNCSLGLFALILIISYLFDSVCCILMNGDFDIGRVRLQDDPAVDDEPIESLTVGVAMQSLSCLDYRRSLTVSEFHMRESRFQTLLACAKVLLASFGFPN